MKRFISATLLFITLLLTATPACTMKKFPATDFFSGSQLVLAQAIEHGDLAKVKELAPKTDLNTPGRKNMTLLFFAFQEALERKPKPLQIMGELVKAGANPQQRVPNFGSVLGVALNATQPDFLRTLLDAGVDPNTMIEGRRPIIFFVTTEENFESLKLLIARGADVNKRDSLRNTALYEALMNWALDQIDYLLDHGANPNTWNVNGVSFAFRIFDHINSNASAPNSVTYKKLIEIRERIIKMGVKWPPETPEQVRARWADAEGWVDDSKHTR
jgi:ankyrin repeat protein